MRKTFTCLMLFSLNQKALPTNKLIFISMKLLTFDMEIIGESDGYFIHKVEHRGQICQFLYHPQDVDLKFPENGSVSELLKRNQSQLLKILKTKKRNTFFKSFRLRFVLIDGKDVNIFNDMTQTIVVDRRGEEDEIRVVEQGKDTIHQIFTDASFLEKTGRSGIAAIIKFPDGNYQLHSFGGNAGNSCHAELEAVVAGFEILKGIHEIRLITDSRYVRKGMTEWIYHWRLNNWQTSSGNLARNISSWKKLDALTLGKYLEVSWIKGHSGHFENTMCDLYARDAAEKQ
jgi:ribonuclease HI